MGLYKLGLLLIAISILLLVLASILMLLYPVGDEGKVGVGGCVVLLFIPICFGVGEHWSLLLTISVALMIVIFLAILLMQLSLYRAEKRRFIKPS